MEVESQTGSLLKWGDPTHNFRILAVAAPKNWETLRPSMTGNPQILRIPRGCAGGAGRFPRRLKAGKMKTV